MNDLGRKRTGYRQGFSFNSRSKLRGMKPTGGNKVTGTRLSQNIIRHLS